MSKRESKQIPIFEQLLRREITQDASKRWNNGTWQKKPYYYQPKIY